MADSPLIPLPTISAEPPATVTIAGGGVTLAPVADTPASASDDAADYSGGWLCPTKADRVRLTDMSPAVRRARLLAGLFCGLGVAVMAPWLGIWPLVLFACAPAPLLLVDAWMSRSARPERINATVLLFNLVLILTAAAISGGEHSPVLPWVAIPVVTAAARFRMPVFLVGSVGAVAAVVGCLFALSAQTVLNDPSPAIAAIVLLAALVVVQQPVLDAEIRWRKDAILDPLTGLLNRQGLKRRFAELAEQARLTGAPVSLMLFDIDNFKAINDNHGHARGDAVLVDIAYALRKQLRSFELLYRLGGDELLLVLPGADRAQVQQVAEEARTAIYQARPAGFVVTTSIGAATQIGPAIDLDRMLEAADRALYAAKRAGRNRVLEAVADAV